MTCVIVGLTAESISKAVLYEGDVSRTVPSIGPYLVPSSDVIVTKSNKNLFGFPEMLSGNKATDAGNLIFSKDEVDAIVDNFPDQKISSGGWRERRSLFKAR